MKIAALGWYGHENEGDERIGYCLKKFVESKGHTLTLIDPFTKDFHKINEFDFVLYGGGGLIHRGFNKCTYLLDQIKRPMGFVGISIEAHDKTNNKFIAKMLEKALFVYVRDKRSAKSLNYHPKVIQSEDLAFLYPWDVVEAPQSSEKVGLNLRSWQFWKVPYSSKVDKKLRALSRKSPKLYTFLTKLPFSSNVYNPAKIVSLLKRKYSNLEGVSFYDEKIAFKKVAPLIGNDQDILSDAGLPPGHFDIERMKDKKFMVSMRLHCVIYCIQLGIPCISLNYEPKNLGLLQNLGLEEIGLSVFSVSEKSLDKHLDYTIKNYDMIRSKFLEYREFAHKDVHKVMGQIFELINASQGNK